MTRLAVLADDLTGALDATAPFAARGIATVVSLGIEELDAALAGGADVLGVSTDSREISPEAARAAVAACMTRLPPGLPIFKKIDSRLKGNIAAELDAIPFRRALVMPAIPSFGRWVQDGRLVGFGVADPIDVAARLGRHADMAVVPDATSQADIESALCSMDHDLPVGARGLAEALALRMAPHELPSSPRRLSAPAICVIGSTDPITDVQIERLRRACPDLAYVPAPDGTTPDHLMVSAPLTVLRATSGNEPTDPVVVARRLGDALIRLQPRPGTALVISGGATAQVVLRALGLAVLELEGEALPGLPIARAGGFTIITKSGGFGDPDTLLRLLGHLGGSERGSYG